MTSSIPPTSTPGEARRSGSSTSRSDAREVRLLSALYFVALLVMYATIVAPLSCS